MHPVNTSYAPGISTQSVHANCTCISNYIPEIHQVIAEGERTHGSGVNSKVITHYVLLVLLHLAENHAPGAAICDVGQSEEEVGCTGNAAEIHVAFACSEPHQLFSVVTSPHSGYAQCQTSFLTTPIISQCLAKILRSTRH